MTRFIFPLLVFAAAVGLPGSVTGQEKPSWVAQVEATLRAEERAWKIAERDIWGAGGSFHETIILKSGGLRADIIIDILDSPELAKEQFDGEEIAFTNILGSGSVKSRQEGLGDDNYVFTGRRGPRRHRNIFFRRGKVLVKVFAPSAEAADRFAKYVIEQLPAA